MEKKEIVEAVTRTETQCVPRLWPYRGTTFAVGALYLIMQAAVIHGGYEHCCALH